MDDRGYLYENFREREDDGRPGYLYENFRAREGDGHEGCARIKVA